MCRLLIADNANVPAFSRKIRAYINLMGLSVDLQTADSYSNALRQLESGIRIDVLFSGSGLDGGRGYVLAEKACACQPWIKRVLVTDVPFPAPHVYVDDYLLADTGMEQFYQVMSHVSPETVRRAAPAVSIDRWASTNAIHQERIVEVLSIIEEEYQQDISLEYLAQRVYISPCYLSTLFSQIMGTSLLAYINDYRMKRATELLSKTDIKIKDISQYVGYRNLPYFCTSFKNKYQLTPAQYRRNHTPVSA